MYNPNEMTWTAYLMYLVAKPTGKLFRIRTPSRLRILAGDHAFTRTDDHMSELMADEDIGRLVSNGFIQAKKPWTGWLDGKRVGLQQYVVIR